MNMKNENKGFSLVELIVVIAIMAVMVAVLAPSLLAYVERSRAAKDNSAMGEVCEAVMLALSDEQIYDEVLYNSCYGNVSSYVDRNAKNGTNAKLAVGAFLIGDDGKVPAGAILLKKANTDQYLPGTTTAMKHQFTYDDDARLVDEEAWTFAGNMRGMTITFSPDATHAAKTGKFVLADGRVNVAVAATRTDGDKEKVDTITWYGGNTGASQGKGETAKFIKLHAPDAGTNNTESKLYHRVRAIVGDEITLSSQTYRNSNYTIFIKVGSQGGNNATAQDAVKVYGQWGGTNLSEAVDYDNVKRQTTPTT